MAKRTFELNVGTAVRWWGRICENQDVPTVQQLVMFHLIVKANNEWWLPVQISMKKLAGLCGINFRTCKAAVDALISSNWLISLPTGYFICVEGKTPYSGASAVTEGVSNGDNPSSNSQYANGLGKSSPVDIEELRRKLDRISASTVKQG